ncbi:Serine/threonine protein kinase (plasmid) [Nostoc flagelliforme CCNUN1]|uniref:Serine/threonine protein kinase n=1 Tax=Nostoc flagelliforme CCNUN1 TaxID=2038116 RepID=A0A2K8TBT4_9NOSO|nr:CHAT domain-containing protein [Nostoc flagelliforme]AUB44535.1 Serine/threonine protein kinase [Nostoc flagelliforme CCNUN1]
MKILHLDLKLVGDRYAELRLFWDNPNNCQSRQLSLTEITKLIQKVETDYYTRLPEDYAKTGQALYNWLDGSDRIFQSAIDQHKREVIVLAIAATEKLAHLPWEILHDSTDFLVNRRPFPIIPIRWVKDDDSKQLTPEDQPANRALNVLFMATSPLEIEPELDFEAEEAQVLSATKRQPLSLIVEESGCLKELGYLVDNNEKNYFDVIHLTGHATFRDKKPCFITETELGEAEYSSAEDIATELQFQLPKLIFLSGCNTGYSSDAGAVPSMAEALLKQGATAVIGWGQRVLDTDAIATAAVLYQELSAGKTLTEAIAIAYQVLLKNQARDWHLLRLYVAETLPGALVKRGRKPVPRASVAQEFLDPEKKLRVATRETFVGRRRQLQNCLRTLKTSSTEVGVLIHGMGGLGKSTIAARLCDRLSEDQPIIWWRQIDESSLVSKLADKLRNPSADDLVKDGLCTQLKNYLQQKQWREADEETAWIFYQVMVKENYKDWEELLRNFPCETLKEINQLWLQNSNDKFGISIQAGIYQSLGGTDSYNEDVWKKFTEQVGWNQSYNAILERVVNETVTVEGSITGTMLASRAPSPSLPVLIYTKSGVVDGAVINFESMGEYYSYCGSTTARRRVISLLSRGDL